MPEQEKGDELWTEINLWLENDETLANRIKELSEELNISTDTLAILIRAGISERSAARTASGEAPDQLAEVLRRLKQLSSQKLAWESTRPQILEEEEYKGFTYTIFHNGRGRRCGYIEVPPGHPWHGKNYIDIRGVAVHGGLTYSAAHLPGDEKGEYSGWYLGFDCCHAGDAPDPQLKTMMPLPSVPGDTIEIRAMCGSNAFFLSSKL